MKPFRFKQFSVQQDKCAMKIGTDGVLLGAWAHPKNAFSILDIGSGTGIISLQMAQKSYAEVIDAIELDANAFEQTVENFEQSDWGDRLFCYHASLQEFSKEMQDEEYDFIISNPPFYNSTFKSEEVSEERALARHTESLSFDVLLNATANLLSKLGECAFIIPYEREEEFLALAHKVNLFPNRITRVKGSQEASIKRSLLQLSFKSTTPKISELIIEIERHIYTPAYIDIVKDFYLKM